jgi:hypothetical protein
VVDDPIGGGRIVIIVGVGELVQFSHGGAVQQGSQPDDRFVRVHLGVGAPPP